MSLFQICHITNYTVTTFIWIICLESSNSLEWDFWVKGGEHLYTFTFKHHIFRRESQLFVSFIFSIIFLFLILLISGLYYFLLSTCFGFILLFFFQDLQWELRLSIWDRSSFLMCSLSTINFSVSTALAVSHTFW